jgi:putative peptidoglycan lipid II flippase
MNARKEKIFIASVLIFGIAVNFLKETIIAYYYGATLVVDSFRIASFLPYMLFQSLGPIFTGLYLPKVMGCRPEEKTFLITWVSIGISLIGIFLSPVYMKLFAPGYPPQQLADLCFKTSICWLVFLIGSLVFHIRIALLAKEKKVAIASISALNASGFLFAIVVINQAINVTESTLYVSFALGTITVVTVLSLFSRNHVLFSGIYRACFSKYDSSPVSVNLIISALLGGVIISLSRVVDRSFASLLEPGMVSSIDYAYNIYIAFGMLVGTSLVIYLSTYIAKHIDDKNVVYLLFQKSLPLVVMGFSASAVVFIFSEDITRLVYLRGAFTEGDVITTSSFLRYAIFALPLMVFNMVIMQLLLGIGSSKYLIIVAVVKLLVKYASMTIMFDYSIYASVGLSNAMSEVAFLLASLFFIKRYSCKSLC